eukprot:2101836-Prorocentrum_lima.AAC.1
MPPMPEPEVSVVASVTGRTPPNRPAPPLPAHMTQTPQVQPKCACGPAIGGLDVGSTVLGGMDDGTTTQCFFTNTPCA